MGYWTTAPHRTEETHPTTRQKHQSDLSTGEFWGMRKKRRCEPLCYRIVKQATYVSRRRLLVGSARGVTAYLELSAKGSGAGANSSCSALSSGRLHFLAAALRDLSRFPCTPLSPASARRRSPAQARRHRGNRDRAARAKSACGGRDPPVFCISRRRLQRADAERPAAGKRHAVHEEIHALDATKAARH